MTMPETSRFLGNQKLEKTIVLVGSHIPANKDHSDALFNLGSALTAVQIKESGVYITMNGHIFDWHNVQKNMATGFFETIN